MKQASHPIHGKATNRTNKGNQKTVHKRVLILTNHSFMLWQFRRELIAALRRQHTVILSMPCGDHVEDFRKMGCKIIDTPIDRRGINPVTDLKLLIHYHALLTRVKPDLVITYSIKPNIYGGLLCRLKRIPYCVNVQGLGTAFQKKGLAEFVTILYRAALKKAGTVFFENEGNASVFRARNILPARQQTVLHGAGINLDYYPFAPHHRKEPVRFLFVGRIMQEKGVDELFAVARRIKADYGSRVAFDLVGFFEDAYKDQVEQLQQEGIITFHGFQQDVRPFYEDADCVILPSWHEGMSNVLLEAAAMGCVLITSDIPGCREAIEPATDETPASGWLCTKGDEVSLEAAIRDFLSLLREEREKKSRIGRQRMETVFDKKAVVKETLQAMEPYW